MTTVKIPYPARRKYNWAYPTEEHTYDDARLIFIRMMRQSPAQDNPARHQAFTLALEALDHLSHNQNVDKFPGPKLHKLLCKSALAADWCPDLGAKQREACAQPVEGSPDMYRCPKCRAIKPIQDFLKPVTTAQRKLWGWTNPQVARTTKAKTCNTCRTNARIRQERQATRTQIRHLTDTYQKLVASGDLSAITPILIDYWSALFAQNIQATKAVKNKSPHAPTTAFYALKVELLEIASQRFETAADSGQMDDYAVAAPHWTMFLEPGEMTDLQIAHVRMSTARRSEQVRGRVPVI
jgi:hypothetical protein